MAQRARIKLASTDIEKINQICSDIKDIARCAILYNLEHGDDAFLRHA